MNTMLCALADTVRAAAIRALSERQQPFSLSLGASEALLLAASERPSVILVGGGTAEATAEACRRLRAAEACGDAVIVATSGRSEDVSGLLEAGAHDVFVESHGEDALRSRLLVAHRRAAGIAYERATGRDGEQFRLLSSYDLLCSVGYDGFFRAVNPAWTATFGWTSAEMLANPSLHLVHPDDVVASIEACRRVKMGARVAGFVNRYRCKDGTYRHLEWRASAVAERHAIYAIARDVTAASATAAALVELSESLATTLNSIGDGVIATGLDGCVFRMNPVAEKLTGWPLADARARPVGEVFRIINGDTREAVENPVEQALREGVTVALARNTLLVRRDGANTPVADSCAPIRAPDGSRHGAVLVFRDITAQRQAEADRAKLQRQLIFADRMALIGTLAAGVAHEINNPLSYVRANLDMAIEGLGALSPASLAAGMKELRAMLLEARGGVERVTKIVGGLKTFCRVGEEVVSAVDLIPVIELSIKMAFTEIRHRARLVTVFGKTPLVLADDARLGQVFINLLVNAAQAIPEGDMNAHEIRVVTSTDGRGWAVIEIRDTGPGIPPKLLERVFDPFVTTKLPGVGTGLGLAISHNIVTEMGGGITVESSAARGTVFRITLPPSAPHAPTTPSATARSLDVNTICSRRAAVLVVDDEPAIGLVIRRVLRQHEVTIVTRAQDALDLIGAGGDFDVVFSDLMMPGLSGMELYRVLARSHPAIASRMVFVTGGAFTPETQAFLREIGNGRIEKPFDSEQLRAMVRAFVDRAAGASGSALRPTDSA